MWTVLLLQASSIQEVSFSNVLELFPWSHIFYGSQRVCNISVTFNPVASLRQSAGRHCDNKSVVVFLNNKKLNPAELHHKNIMRNCTKLQNMMSSASDPLDLLCSSDFLRIHWLRTDTDSLFLVFSEYDELCGNRHVCLQTSHSSWVEPLDLSLAWSLLQQRKSNSGAARVVYARLVPTVPLLKPSVHAGGR